MLIFLSDKFAIVKIVLSGGQSFQVRALARLVFLRITFFLHFFLSLYFHELCCSLMSDCLFNEIKLQWAMLVLGWVTASCVSVHYCFAAHVNRLKDILTLLIGTFVLITFGTFGEYLCIRKRLLYFRVNYVCP